MIITRLTGGLGNQLFQYATGRRLAHKLGVDLKFDALDHCRLNDFNIRIDFAAPEEIKQLSDKNAALGIERVVPEAATSFMPEVLDYPDDVYLRGGWQCEKYFADIADILRRELTLNIGTTGGGKKSSEWLAKIRAAECAVSLQVDRKDFNGWEMLEFFGLLPLDYYYDCVQAIKQVEKNITVFVFADDIGWAKERFHFGVPTEFVDGCERDVDGLLLMSQCKHNIIANTAFGWWGAWLNSNLDKRVCAPEPWFRHSRYNVDLIPAEWIKIPARLDKFPTDNVSPGLSIIVCSSGDSDMLKNTLDNLMAQNYFWCELIIIDDGVGSICKDAAKKRKDIQLVSFNRKIGKSAAWNLGINMSRGQFVLLLEGGDYIINDRILEMLTAIRFSSADMLHSAGLFFETPQGNFAFGGKRFASTRDPSLKTLNGSTALPLPALKGIEIFANQRINPRIGTKIFRRDFLIENRIRFNETLDDIGAEMLFLAECFLKLDNIILTSQLLYLETDSKMPPSFDLWRADFDKFRAEIKRLLSSIEDETQCEDFELRLAYQYLNQF